MGVDIMEFRVYQQDTCLKEIRQRAQNMIIVLDSKFSIIEGKIYGHLMSTRIVHFDTE